MLNGTNAAITVADDGAGVTRTNATTSSSPAVAARRPRLLPEGQGSRLALAQRLAHSVGGEIAAEPTQHGGRFTISLPLA